MKPRPKPQDSGTEELFRSKLKNIINLRHEPVRLGELIDWARLEAHFAPYYSEAGRPGLPIRLVMGLRLRQSYVRVARRAAMKTGRSWPPSTLFRRSQPSPPPQKPL